MTRVRAGELLVRTAAFILVAEVSVGSALVALFAIPAGPQVGGVDLSLSWPLVVVLNPTLVVLAARLDRWRWTPAVSIGIWLGVVLYLGTSRAEGDVLIPADLNGLTFLLLGGVSGGLALARQIRR